MFGDSLTTGRIGIAYRRYIPVPSEVHGIEGDTLAGTMSRIRRYLSRRSPGRLTTIVLQAGANDLLLPFMAKRYPDWNRTIQVQLPTEDIDTFRRRVLSDFEELSTLVGDTLLVCCSLPILGEQLGSELNRTRAERNEVLFNAVQQIRNFQWCDITTAVENLIVDQGGDSPYLPEHPQDLETDVSRIVADEEKAAMVSRERQLIATIDGIHPNGAGAQLIGTAITTSLRW